MDSKVPSSASQTTKSAHAVSSSSESAEVISSASTSFVFVQGTRDTTLSSTSGSRSGPLKEQDTSNQNQVVSFAQGKLLIDNAPLQDWFKTSGRSGPYLAPVGDEERPEYTTTFDKSTCEINKIMASFSGNHAKTTSEDGHDDNEASRAHN